MKTYMIDVKQFNNVGKFAPESELKKIGDTLKLISATLKQKLGS